MCTWLDLSGNLLKFNCFADNDNVPGTVNSRNKTIPAIPDTWGNFKVKENVHRLELLVCIFRFLGLYRKR